MVDRVIEELPSLVAAEILELEGGQSITLHIRAWQLGRMVITPANAPQGKTIRVLRVWVPVAEKPLGPDYWDITSQTLIYQLIPFLEKGGFQARTYTITKYGIAPRARFTVVVT